MIDSVKSVGRLCCDKAKHIGIGLATVGMSTLAVGTNVYANSEGTSAAVTTALKSTADQITGVLNQIAPIGLGIAGTFLVWRYGMRFFKSLSK